MSELPMSPQVFAILTALVEERVGLHFGAENRELFVDRVSSRALECGFDSLLDYYYLLRYDDPAGAELQRLVEALVINETYFFREIDQLSVVARRVAELAAKGHQPRVWSAACSTGEEPLTLAMLLAESNVLDKVEIVATDISHRVLAKAREGRFTHRSVRTVPMRAIADRWLRQEKDQVVAATRLVDAVRWRQLNLLDDAAVAKQGLFDVILCRNVLIYFKDDIARRVVENVASRLTSGGVLFVGVSESLMRFGTALSCEEQEGVFFYKWGGES